MGTGHSCRAPFYNVLTCADTTLRKNFNQSGTINRYVLESQLPSALVALSQIGKNNCNVHRVTFSAEPVRENNTALQLVSRRTAIAVEVEHVPKSISETIGEICRELAVLVLIFVPLELYQSAEISRLVLAAAIVGSIVLATIGILIEWLRKQ